jgi:hypothetical protein
MEVPKFPPLLDIEISIGSDGMPYWHKAREWTALLPILENQKIKNIVKKSYRSYTSIKRTAYGRKIDSNNIFRIVDFSRFHDLGGTRFPKGGWSTFKKIIFLLLGEHHEFKIIGWTNDYPIIAANWIEVRILKDIIVICIKYIQSKRFSKNKIMISKVKKECGDLISQAQKLFDSIQDFDDEWFDVLFDSCSIKFNELGSPALDYMSWKIGSFESCVNDDLSHVKAMHQNVLLNLIQRFEKADLFLERINMEISGNAFERLIGNIDLMLMSRSLLIIEKYADHIHRDRKISTIMVYGMLKCFLYGDEFKGIDNSIQKKEYAEKYSNLYDSVRAWRKLVSRAETKWREAVEASLEKPECKERLTVVKLATRDLEFLFRGPGPAKAAKLL